MIALLRPPIRMLLQAWGSLGKAPGWRYQAIERYGAALASSSGTIGRLPNGFTMQCDLRDEVQRQIYFWGCYEPVESLIFATLVQPGMTVIDAGANVGNYTLLASSATGDRGHVYAFEPVPATNARLTASVNANHLRNVTITRMALWDEESTLKLGLPTGHDQNAGAYSVGGDGASVSAPAQPLDVFLAKTGVARVDIIKMDVEGAEFRALQGMRQTLTRDHPLLLMEVNKEAAQSAGSSPAQLGRLLIDELGYKAWRLDTGAPTASLDSIERANVLFHVGEAPAAVREVVPVKQALKWARSGRIPRQPPE